MTIKINNTITKKDDIMKSTRTVCLSLTLLGLAACSPDNNIQSSYGATHYFENELNFTTNPHGVHSAIQEKQSMVIVDVRAEKDYEAGHIPGAINRDVAKASADRSLQTLGVASLDDSWGAQAAGAGIEAAKSLLSKKVKLVKVVVKAGYMVLLRDENQKQKDSN